MLYNSFQHSLDTRQRDRSILLALPSYIQKKMEHKGISVAYLFQKFRMTSVTANMPYCFPQTLETVV